MKASRHEALHVVVIRHLAKSLKTDKSKELCDGEISFLRYISISESVVPNAYADLDSFRKDWFLFNLFKKYRGWSDGNTDQDKKRVALSRWYLGENRCKETNFRLSPFLDPNFKSDDRALNMVIETTRRKIKDCIGERPCFKTLVDLARTSSGASANHRRFTSRLQKHTIPSSTTSALKYLGCYTAFQSFDFNNLIVEESGRGETVPKDAKTDRFIDMQPSFNGYIQQSVGRFFRQQLLSILGVDLNDQCINQVLAFEAIFDNLCTLDLEMASDTVSLLVVCILFPQPWVDFLLDIRTESTTLKVEELTQIRLEKFSAMGNAFTFELESLIFSSLLLSIKELNAFKGPVSVYGDDLIVPAEMHAQSVHFLSILGFVVNEEKSFTPPSRFFESCGKHYYDAEDVTPAYQKADLTDEMELIRLHNKLYRWANRTNGFKYVVNTLSLLKKEWGGDCPEVPYWTQRDDGFINRHASDDDCYSLVIKTRNVSLANRRHDDVLYESKLLLRDIMNESPKGYTTHKQMSEFVIPSVKVSRKYQKVFHWRSNCMETNQCDFGDVTSWKR